MTDPDAVIRDLSKLNTAFDDKEEMFEFASLS